MILNVAPYYAKLKVVITDDVAEEMCELTNEEVVGGGDACCTDYQGDGFQYLLVMKHNVPMDVIAHESLHIVNMIFRDKGIKWNYNNDEPAAYLLGWLVENIGNYASNHISSGGEDSSEGKTFG